MIFLYSECSGLKHNGLKGADAAMYGSLGSNGVIMIETDKAAFDT